MRYIGAMEAVSEMLDLPRTPEDLLVDIPAMADPTPAHPPGFCEKEAQTHELQRAVLWSGWVPKVNSGDVTAMGLESLSYSVQMPPQALGLIPAS